MLSCLQTNHQGQEVLELPQCDPGDRGPQSGSRAQETDQGLGGGQGGQGD